MTEFQVGDMVIDPVRFEGKNKIADILTKYNAVSDHDLQYPIRIHIGALCYKYTIEGKYHLNDLLPSLHPA